MTSQFSFYSTAITQDAHSIPTPRSSDLYAGIHGGGGSWELRVMADGRFGATFYQSIGPSLEEDTCELQSRLDRTWRHAAAVLRNGLVDLYVDGIVVVQGTTNPITSVRSS